MQRITDPLRAVLKAMTGVEPPACVRGYNFDNLTDDQLVSVQDWCVDNVRPSWCTGIGLMDVAERQVKEACGNYCQRGRIVDIKVNFWGRVSGALGTAHRVHLNVQVFSNFYKLSSEAQTDIVRSAIYASGYEHVSDIRFEKEEEHE